MDRTAVLVPVHAADVIRHVVCERVEQVLAGYDATHDDGHTVALFEKAIAAYLGRDRLPWNGTAPAQLSHRVRLVRVAALAIAAIERMDRESMASNGELMRGADIIQTDFHWAHGIHFRRLHEGSVEVSRHATDGDEKQVDVWAVVPPHEWSSIVAAVAAGGRGDAERHEIAQVLHGERVHTGPMLERDVDLLRLAAKMRKHGTDERQTQALQDDVDRFSAGLRLEIDEHARVFVNDVEMPDMPQEGQSIFSRLGSGRKSTIKTVHGKAANGQHIVTATTGELVAVKAVNHDGTWCWDVEHITASDAEIKALFPNLGLHEERHAPPLTLMTGENVQPPAKVVPGDVVRIAGESRAMTVESVFPEEDGTLVAMLAWCQHGTDGRTQRDTCDVSELVVLTDDEAAAARAEWQEHDDAMRSRELHAAAENNEQTHADLVALGLAALEVGDAVYVIHDTTQLPRLIESIAGADAVCTWLDGTVLHRDTFELNELKPSFAAPRSSSEQ